MTKVFILTLHLILPNGTGDYERVFTSLDACQDFKRFMVAEKLADRVSKCKPEEWRIVEAKN